MGIKIRKTVGFILLFSAAAFSLDSTIIRWTQQPYYLDGRALPPEDILEFTVHYGVRSKEYIYQQSVPGNQFNLEIILPNPGIWYFAMTATDIYSQTSYFSYELERYVSSARRPKPMKITVQVID